jgi:uncharacterized protein (DUF2237 family)
MLTPSTPEALAASRWATPDEKASLLGDDPQNPPTTDTQKRGGLTPSAREALAASRWATPEEKAALLNNETVPAPSSNEHPEKDRRRCRRRHHGQRGNQKPSPAPAQRANKTQATTNPKRTFDRLTPTAREALAASRWATAEDRASLLNETPASSSSTAPPKPKRGGLTPSTRQALAASRWATPEDRASLLAPLQALTMETDNNNDKENSPPSSDDNKEDTPPSTDDDRGN